MTAVKFNEPFEINYEGWIYKFSPDKVVKVEDEVYAFLNDRVPLSFEKVEAKNINFLPKVEKVQAIPWSRPPKRGVFGGEVANVSQAVFNGSSQVVSQPVDVTPPGGTVDSDGVEWYGKGEERE